MSRHWRPERSDWTTIDGPGGSTSGRRDGGVVPAVLVAVLIGLMAGGALSWATQQADSEPTGLSARN